MEEEVTQPIYCVNCEVAVGHNNKPFIRCTECTTKDNEVILCAWCFLMGAECGLHKRGHNYQVEDPSGPPIFHTKTGGERPWGWKEDMDLIAAAHKFRLGNWDEIARSMKTDRTAEEAKNHFDRYFVRGALGRHASSIVARPFVDDMTVGDCCGPERDPAFGGGGRQSVGASRWQYVVDFIRENDISADLNDPNWFEQLREDLHRYRDEREPAGNEDGSAFNETLLSDTTSMSVAVEGSSSAVTLTPPLSPIRVLVNSAEASSDESSELGASVTLHRARRFSHVPIVSSGTMRSSSDETEYSTGRQESPKRASLPGPSRMKRMKYMTKKERRLKRMTSKNKEGNGVLSKSKLSIKIGERDQERLLASYAQHCAHLSSAATTSHAEKISKVKEDDLQLLAYMPKRDDFEQEYNNECERLISRLQLNLSTDGEEDEEFANAVKINKVLYYNRQMMQRRQRKAMMREFDLISEFFDKVKNNAAHPHHHKGSPQSRAVDRRRDENRKLMNKVRQVVNKEEMKELGDVITKLDSFTKRIEELKDMKARGIKALKPGQKVDHEHHNRKRKRRGDKYRSSQHKATLRWNRFKRWNKRQQLKSEATESDT